MSTPNDLSNLHQQSINEFLMHGGIVHKECTYKIHNHQVTARFIRDAKYLSHPISPIIYQDFSYINKDHSPIIASNSSISSSLGFECINSLSQYLSHLCTSKLSIDNIKLLAGNKSSVRDHNYGLNSISFDHHGALFATAGSNGLIRVYDFDECQSGMQLKKVEINPVVSFDTKKDVSSIAWSYNNEDEIAVAFTFRPEIQIYDLSANFDNINTNNNQVNNCFHQNSQYIRILDICGNSKSGGHNVVIYFPIKKSANNSKVISEEPVIAGSSNGFIRYWNSYRNPKNSIWSVLADPLRSSLNASPVVALLLLYNSSYQTNTDDNLLRSKTKIGKTTNNIEDTTNCDMNHHLNPSSTSTTSPLLLSATAQGVLVIWNVSNLRATSFGSSNPEPQSLKRIDYTTQLLLFDPIKLIGVTSYNMSQQHCSLLAATTDNVFLSISNGEIYIGDLWKEVIIKNNEETAISNTTSNISRLNTKSSSYSDNPTRRLRDPNQLIEYQNGSSLNCNDNSISVINRYCPAMFPNWMKNTAIVTKTLNGNITLNMYDLSTRNYNAYTSNVTYPNTITSNGLYSVSGKAADILTGVVRSNMRRCGEVSCTLPGYVMSAELGSHDIVTSQDLQSYLTHEAAVLSCYNKTHEIQFDWSHFMSGAPYSSINKSYRSEYNNIIDENGVPATSTKSVNKVMSMGYNSSSNQINTGHRGHHITLSSNYVGPTVRNGEPKVYIRCNLLPGSRTLNELTYDPRKQITSVRSTDDWLCRERVISSDCTDGRICTATATHPYFPAFIAGLNNEEIILIVPHDYKLDQCIEENIQEVYVGNVKSSLSDITSNKVLNTNIKSSVVLSKSNFIQNDANIAFNVSERSYILNTSNNCIIHPPLVTTTDNNNNENINDNNTKQSNNNNNTTTTNNTKQSTDNIINNSSNTKQSNTTYNNSNSNNNNNMQLKDNTYMKQSNYSSTNTKLANKNSNNNSSNNNNTARQLKDKKMTFKSTSITSYFNKV